MNNDEIEAQRELLKHLTKIIIKEIKELEDTSNLYTQEDVWINSAVKQKLINWKIHFEKTRKALKYQLK